MINYDKFISLIKTMLVPRISNKYKIFSLNKSVIICGNGKTGYSEHSSKFIDSHDLVVRINNVLLNNLIGSKYQCLFAGGSQRSHLTDDQFYPTLNQFKTIITTKNVWNNILPYKNIETLPIESNIIFYDRKLICQLLNKINYGSYKQISGIHCICLFLAIYIKYNLSKISFIGFDAHNIASEVVTYYHNNILIDPHISDYHNKHNWQFHTNFIDMLQNSMPECFAIDNNCNA